MRSMEMDGLAEDIIKEILAILPVKSIVRARCVSKSWNRLIAGEHRLGKRLPPVMAAIIVGSRNFYGRATFVKTGDASCYDGESPADDYDFSFVPSHRGLNVVSVCSGLALCSVFAGESDPVVCNPATRRWKGLRTPDRKDFRPLAIGFDPRRSRHYRVLGCYKDNFTASYKFNMFLSETDEWEDCAGNYLLEPSSHESIECVFVSGIFYVMHAVSGRHSFQNRKKTKIFAVDIAEKNCTRIELPYHVSRTWSQSSIGVSEGFLHLSMRWGNELLVWAREHCGWTSRWVGIGQKVVACDGCSFLCFHPDTNVIFVGIGGMLFSYNFKSSNLEVIDCMKEIFFRGFRYHPFSPCSSPPDGL